MRGTMIIFLLVAACDVAAPSLVAPAPCLARARWSGAAFASHVAVENVGEGPCRFGAPIVTGESAADVEVLPSDAFFTPLEPNHTVSLEVRARAGAQVMLIRTLEIPLADSEAPVRMNLRAAGPRRQLTRDS